MSDPVDYFETVMRLKDEKRTGWALRGISYPESVAAHTFGTAFLAWQLAEDSLDTDKVLKMALVHDIHESISGDIPSGGLDESEQQEKHDAEQQAFRELLSQAPYDTAELERLWKEYEKRETKEARFVKDMDLLDMVLQAYIYDTQDRADADAFHKETATMDEFFEHSLPQFSFDRPKQLAKDIHTRYTENNT